MAELRFGFCVPVFANPGPAFFRTPDLGVSHFMLWFLDFPSLAGIQLFSEQVMPALRRTA